MAFFTWPQPPCLARLLAHRGLTATTAAALVPVLLAEREVLRNALLRFIVLGAHSGVHDLKETAERVLEPPCGIESSTIHRTPEMRDRAAFGSSWVAFAPPAQIVPTVEGCTGTSTPQGLGACSRSSNAYFRRCMPRASSSRTRRLRCPEE